MLFGFTFMLAKQNLDNTIYIRLTHLIHQTGRIYNFDYPRRKFLGSITPWFSDYHYCTT